MPDIEVGKRIRKLRESHKYTRDVLSEKADISSKFLYEIEAGQKGFSSAILLRLAQTFSVSCDYIMTGKGWNSTVVEQIDSIMEGLDEEQMGQMKNILQSIRDMCV